ncbi:MAG: TIM barrel protein [Verrucomicrobia bacterium]|nr:MAG: TIM barrel protein [Verrucomicrobiota bacterium]
MKLTRRSALATAAGTAAAVSLSQRLASADAAVGSKGRIHHSVCKWCYPKVSLEELCRAAKDIGLASIELLGPGEWPVLARHGLTCAMTSNPTRDGLGGINKAFNRTEHHDALVAAYSEWIPAAAKAGLKNVICFSGNRGGMDDETGLVNCAVGLKRLMPLCEQHGITLVMELLNSKVDHKDYQCDHSAWGVELCHRVGSDRFKLLYDIYHMQIMEGDVIATIRKQHAHIAHYHTGGVPGRNEIDETQELNYPAIMQAIVATGFQGHVAQEFVPKRPDVLASLKQGVRICDV